MTPMNKVKEAFKYYEDGHGTLKVNLIDDERCDQLGYEYIQGETGLTDCPCGAWCEEKEIIMDGGFCVHCIGKDLADKILAELNDDETLDELEDEEETERLDEIAQKVGYKDWSDLYSAFERNSKGFNYHNYFEDIAKQQGVTL
jgi:AraC-like DNA-binding protein